MFHTAVELRGQHERWGLDPDQDRRAPGSWLLERIRGFGGAGIVSHELLAAATRDQVQRVAADTADLELHVVVTARDLSRQATALWQEEVKNGRALVVRGVQRRLVRSEDGAEQGHSGFWRSQDLASVLTRWGSRGPTGPAARRGRAPQQHADPFELWRRFAGGDRPRPGAPSTSSSQPRANESLGAAQVALLRQVVDRPGRAARPAALRPRRQAVLRPDPAEPDQLAGPGHPAGRPAASSTASPGGWVEEIRERGYAVHGDLDELVPGTAPVAEGARHPDDVHGRGACSRGCRRCSRRCSSRSRCCGARSAARRALPPLRADRPEPARSEQGRDVDERRAHVTARLRLTGPYCLSATLGVLVRPSPSSASSPRPGRPAEPRLPRSSGGRWCGCTSGALVERSG